MYQPVEVGELEAERGRIAKIGARVRKDEVIGEVRDFFGNTREVMKALFDGLVPLVQYHLWVDQGKHLIQPFILENTK